MSKEIVLVIPKWLFDKNLGDSVNSTFIPKVLREHFRDNKITVVTSGFLLELFQDNPWVDEVRTPLPNSIKSDAFWRYQALNNRPGLASHIFCIYPEWHSNLWSYWSQNFDYLTNHKTATLITVNYLLQLGLEKYLYTDLNLYPYINIKPIKKDKNLLGIVPEHKLANRDAPHPGCDGKGLRFNGDNGESWKTFCKSIKELNPDIHIVEFSKNYMGFGDSHIGYLSIKNLAQEIAKLNTIVLSDGGIHHVATTQDVNIVLLSAQKINKYQFYQHGKTKVYKSLYSKCDIICENNIKSLSCWNDLSKTCDLSCENINPDILAAYIEMDFFTNEYR